jgi:peroxiredoxin
VADLAKDAERFKEKNVTLAVIGSGDPGHFSEFREKTGYDGMLFSDPSLKAFSLLGFSKSLMGFMSIRSVIRAASALTQGHRQGSIQGSTLQLGGAIVIDASGAVRYFFAGSKAGDHPDVDEVLKAVEK